jgi:hypothetical protein
MGPQEADMIQSRQPRFSQRLAMRFSTGDGALPRGACTLDVSANGLFVRSQRVLPEGTHVLGRVDLPGGATAEVHGVVAWSRAAPRSVHEVPRGGMGLRLLWADEPYFQFLARAAG